MSPLKHLLTSSEEEEMRDQSNGEKVHIHTQIRRKAAVIWDYWSFFRDNTYSPGLPITHHNPILTQMPTSSSTVFFAYPFFGPFLSVDTRFTGTLSKVPPHTTYFYIVKTADHG